MQCKDYILYVKQPGFQATGSTQNPAEVVQSGFSYTCAKQLLDKWCPELGFINPRLPCAAHKAVVAVQVNPNAILVSQRQKGNPVLQHIRNVRYAFADIIPDYQMGQQTCALFLSLRRDPETLHNIPLIGLDFEQNVSLNLSNIDIM